MPSTNSSSTTYSPKPYYQRTGINNARQTTFPIWLLLVARRIGQSATSRLRSICFHLLTRLVKPNCRPNKFHWRNGFLKPKNIRRFLMPGVSLLQRESTPTLTKMTLCGVNGSWRLPFHCARRVAGIKNFPILGQRVIKQKLHCPVWQQPIPKGRHCPKKNPLICTARKSMPIRFQCTPP